MIATNWLKELARINEEEAARAKRASYALWDFSISNTITREPIPLPGDLTPMRCYWDHSHYDKATGDLILDRIFDYSDPARSRARSPKSESRQAEATCWYGCVFNFAVTAAQTIPPWRTFSAFRSGKIDRGRRPG
jgi:hypothetical protein